MQTRKRYVTGCGCGWRLNYVSANMPCQKCGKGFLDKGGIRHDYVITERFVKAKFNLLKPSTWFGYWEEIRGD